MLAKATFEITDLNGLKRKYARLTGNEGKDFRTVLIYFIDDHRGYGIKMAKLTQEGLKVHTEFQVIKSYLVKEISKELGKTVSYEEALKGQLSSMKDLGIKLIEFNS